MESKNLMEWNSCGVWMEFVVGWLWLGTSPLPRPKSNPIDFINFLFLCLAPSAISLKEDEQTHLLFFSLATQLIKEWKEEKELMSLMSVKPITHYAVMKNWKFLIGAAANNSTILSFLPFKQKDKSFYFHFSNSRIFWIELMELK